MGNARTIAFWLVLFLLVVALFNLFSGTGSTLQSKPLAYSEFVSAVNEGTVSEVTLDGETVRFQDNAGVNYMTIKPEDAEVTKLLIEKGIPVQAESQEQSGFQAFLLTLAPFLLLIAVWVYFMNRMQG
ncbi:MAG TPA: cell division protein FtsH, partial [Roseovarius nubinhibens]|nr:cell division protein FtsH [Roseovarius nubinhibens]